MGCQASKDAVSGGPASSPRPAAKSGGTVNHPAVTFGPPHRGSGKGLKTVYFSIEECDQQTADFELGEGGAGFSGDPDDHPYPAFGQAFPNNPPGGENSQDCFPNTIWSDVPVVDALADSGDAAPAWASKFDEIVKGYLTKNQMPGGCQLAIVKAGEGVVYSRAFGVGSMTDPAVSPLSPQNRLYYGSISKTITCVAAMVLVEGGKLSLDEKVLNYLGGDAAACADPRVADVTVKMLMNHTSGMTDGGGMGSEGIDTSSSQATVALLSAMTLARDPGTAYEYANFGANIMGRVIEKASGQEYEAFVCKAVWAPIGCDNYPVVSSKYKMHPGEVPHYTPIRPGDRQAGRDDGVEPWWKYMWGGPNCAQGNKDIGMEGAGGWKGRAQDIAMLGADIQAGLFGPDGSSRILKKQATIKTMVGSNNSHPDAMGDPATSWYSLGWIGWAQDASQCVEGASFPGTPLLMHGGTFGSDLNLIGPGLTFAFCLSAQPHFDQSGLMHHVSTGEDGLKTQLRNLCLNLNNQI